MSDAKIYIQSWVGNVVFDDIDCLIQLADRFNMTIGLIHNGRQYTINPKDTQMDVLKRYDSDWGKCDYCGTELHEGRPHTPKRKASKKK